MGASSKNGIFGTLSGISSYDGFGQNIHMDRTMSCTWPKLFMSNYHYELSSCGNNPITKWVKMHQAYTNESCTDVSAVKPIIMHFSSQIGVLTEGKAY